MGKRETIIKDHRGTKCPNLFFSTTIFLPACFTLSITSCIMSGGFNVFISDAVSGIAWLKIFNLVTQSLLTL